MSNTNLITHAGAWSAKREDISIPEVPHRTWSYTPIPHERIVNTLHELIPMRGMAIKDEKYALASAGNKMFGVMDITNGNGQSDWGLALGFRNSYDKSMVLGLAGGSRVFVCDNLAFAGDIVVHRKHTGTVDKELRHLIGSMLDAFVATKADIGAFIDRMKQREISNTNAHDFICRAVRGGILPTSHVSKVLEQWYEPKHADFNNRTQWSLYNAFTEVAKDRSEGLQMTSTIGLTALSKQWDEEMNNA